MILHHILENNLLFQLQRNLMRVLTLQPRAFSMLLRALSLKRG